MFFNIAGGLKLNHSISTFKNLFENFKMLVPSGSCFTSNFYFPLKTRKFSLPALSILKPIP